ncbi:MAG: S-layer homology domain-containing protein, partial [Clostridia bacterium]|nr:S-layer homology domain-containing protein [Clostridia bacterium]
ETSAKTTFTMPAKAVTVKATYKDKPVTKYTVTVENGTGGGSYAAKATVTITADAPASDKVFDKWISSDGVTFADETSAKTTFTMPAKAVTVKATYKDKPVTKYTVTVENGTGGGSYAAKAAVTITADAPASDKAFDKWVSSDGVTFADETSAKTTFEMPEKEVTVKATYKDKYNYSHGGSGGGGYSRYDVIIGNAEHGALTAAPKQPIRGDTVVLTAVPDAGYETVDVVVLDKNGKPVEVTKNADGTYSYQQPAGDVSVNVVFKPKNPFIDVSESSYYFAPVLWAVENGITNGTGDDTFGPEKTCTRAQLVTFLWRAEGCPEPTITESPFTDVPMNAYYYKAVLWAYENGVAKGVGEGRFDPDSTVTRGQSVTFLYRIAGSETDGEMPFVDVMEGEYWYDAILWAYKTGVTLGTSETTFGPNENCRRGDIVTFLYRVYNK